MPSKTLFNNIFKVAVTAAAVSLAAPHASADETSAMGGLLRAPQTQAEAAPTYPLPAKFTATTRKDWTHFAVKDVTTNETFNMQVYPHYPVAEGVQPSPLTCVENDGKTFIVPIDLTGRGVADLIIGRQQWSGWRVYTNGQRLAKPFDGFVEGFLPKGAEAVQGPLLPMDLTELRVDNNLLGAVGDFLGNGTEQLAYFRPGWENILVVGAHGLKAMPADLRGIPVDKDGERLHFLFPYRSDKPGERTRLAYHRHGVPRMLMFTFEADKVTRTEVEAKDHWNLLNQFNPNPL
jgi:hypothetical protein